MKNIINRHLHRFGLELHGSGYLQSLAKGEFKKDAFMVQKELMAGKRVNTIFDLGANRGEVLARYLECFPSSSIYAFEPFPGSFDILKDRFGSVGSVHLHPLAVACSEGLRQLYVNRNVDTNSLLKPRATGLSSDKQVKNKSVLDIQSTSLDLFCTSEKIGYIDILKMDIQGGELEALKGGVNLLRENKIGLIYSEAFFVKQYESQPLFHEIAGFLYEFDYRLQDIYAPMYGKGHVVWADVIFTKK
jgi:FkbM family methyltransferase